MPIAAPPMTASPPPTTPPRTKPRFRGRSHYAAFFLALGAAAVLVATAHTARAAAAAAIYGACLAAMFGVSALYHLPTWRTDAARQRMRRLDHATIFLLIAGTYTPFGMLALAPAEGRTLLVTVWSGAALGLVQAVAWVRAPKTLTAALYVALGWIVLPYTSQILAAIGPGAFATLVAGGVVYSAGAVIYALRRPDPAPAVFGYHEIFHALVIVASICHFAVVVQVMRAAR